MNYCVLFVGMQIIPCKKLKGKGSFDVKRKSVRNINKNTLTSSKNSTEKYDFNRAMYKISVYVSNYYPKSKFSILNQ